MADYLLLKSYSHRSVSKVKDLVHKALQKSWLEDRFAEIYQICDELIKNAVKSNYKFLLIWRETRKRLLDSGTLDSEEEADDWLREVFFAGEDILIKKLVDHLPDRTLISSEVRSLLDLENILIEFKKREDLKDNTERMQAASHFKDHRADLLPLMEIKHMARTLKIYVHLKVEKSTDQLLITVTNDSPILKEDVDRIKNIREKFSQYVMENRMEEFFIESLDTSGGGHGLGYAIMDSALLDLGLRPETSLYMINTDRTMVLLNLPLVKPDST